MRNELGGSSCHAFSENLHLIHTSAEVLKTLYLAVCVQDPAQVSPAADLTVAWDLCEYLPPEDENTHNRLLSSRRIDLAGSQAAWAGKRPR